MTSTLYKNPTVKKVIFQIRFPNLFYLESKIPDIQCDILDKFPESALIFQQAINLSVGNKDNINNNQLTTNEKSPFMIWQFKNNDGYILEIQNGSLTIISDLHKTYDNEGAQNKFRDVIEYVIQAFLKHIKLPFITRIGLRYIDEIPLPKKSTNSYKRYFNTSLSFNRVNIDDLRESYAKIVKNIDNYTLVYQEYCKYYENETTEVKQPIVVLDFDAMAFKVQSTEYLNVTDKLHGIVSGEYEAIIKDKLREVMNKS